MCFCFFRLDSFVLLYFFIILIFCLLFRLGSFAFLCVFLLIPMVSLLFRPRYLASGTARQPGSLAWEEEQDEEGASQTASQPARSLFLLILIVFLLFRLGSFAFLCFFCLFQWFLCFFGPVIWPAAPPGSLAWEEEQDEEGASQTASQPARSLFLLILTVFMFFRV